jgi:DNA-binding ferritin-like protein
MELKSIKERIIAAGYKAVEELIKIAEDKVLSGGDDDLSADKLKNAAATKRLAIEDAFQILSRIELEQEKLVDDSVTNVKTEPKVQGFAERRSK